VRVPPIKQAIDPLIQTQTMQTPKQAAEAEPDSFLQPMQIPKPQPATDHLSQTIPRLKH
ncbi:MAG: hypothetical protein ACI8ZV_001447, partial [Chitinophagales bacterium]